MPKNNLLRQVTGCIDCPFAAPAGYCTLHPAKIEITDQLSAGPSAGLLSKLEGIEPVPADCPLRRRSCLVALKYEKPRAGRPRQAVTAGRDFAREVAHFRAWLAKQNRNQFNKTGLTIPLTELVEENQYGPALKLPHFRAAVAGKRPFNEAELDKAVAYATAQQGYTPEPPRPRFPETLPDVFTL